MKETLTVYMQIGEKRNGWRPMPRLLRATARSNGKTHPDTVSLIRLDLHLPESVFRSVRPGHTISVNIDESLVQTIDVEQVEP